jgi:type II secretory pathway pseudopilin PulG
MRTVWFTPAGSPRGRGFSVIELIVVGVLLAVLAGVAAPRMASFLGRQVRADAAAVGEMLSAAARRDALVSQPLALDYDGEAGVLRVLVLTQAQDGARWAEDRLMPSVVLAGAVLEHAAADGAGLNQSGWWVEFPQGGRRPGIELVLASDRSKERWQVVLPSGASQAVVRPAVEGAPLASGAVDLDDAGQGSAPW